MTITLDQKVGEFASEFAIDGTYVQQGVRHFVNQTAQALGANMERAMPMIPSFVTRIPTGKEKGVQLAVDLGGTNFRVSSVHLNGDHTHKTVSSKVAVSDELMTGGQAEFFSFLAKQVQDFLREHHSEHFTQTEPLRMGVTFSFPVNQVALDKGFLIRWTKGYDIKDAVGKDVVELFQTQLDALDLNVKIVALVNDTVGTLLARAYASKSCDGEHKQTLIGAIFGTGTNGAYSERLKRVPKFTAENYPEVFKRYSAEQIANKTMIINTEWGSYDNDIDFLPNTKWDVALDSKTHNKSFHMFEKRISGMFLGEILRLCILDLKSEGLILQSTKLEDNTVWRDFGMDTSVLSFIEAATAAEIKSGKDDYEKIIKAMGLTSQDITPEQVASLKPLVTAIGRRSAYLSAIPLAAITLHTHALDKFDVVDIGVDGSVFQFYPNFANMVKEAMSYVDGISVDRIDIGHAEDGSGVGAALAAYPDDKQ
ncbi:Glucokinase [Yarrowia sp. B02]|nr:Glucokinase [Yarrowia sp. B02]